MLLIHGEDRLRITMQRLQIILIWNESILKSGFRVAGFTKHCVMKNAPFKGRKSNAIITKKHRKLHKGFTFCGSQVTKHSGDKFRAGDQHNDNDNDDSYYSPSLTMLEAF